MDQNHAPLNIVAPQHLREMDAETRGRTGDLPIFSLALSQLGYRGTHNSCSNLRTVACSRSGTSFLQLQKIHLARIELATFSV